MDYSTTTLFYDGQFWILTSETRSHNGTFIGRYVFGPEPGNPELLEFVLTIWIDLTEVGTNDVQIKQTARSYKKRLHKNRSDQNNGKTISRSKDLLKMALSAGKTERQQVVRSARDALEALKRERAIQKRKQKKRGR